MAASRCSPLQASSHRSWLQARRYFKVDAACVHIIIDLFLIVEESAQHRACGVGAWQAQHLNLNVYSVLAPVRHYNFAGPLQCHWHPLKSMVLLKGRVGLAL